MKDQTVGILVHGSNHFIVRGPRPDPTTAKQLVQHWSIIRIGAVTPLALRQWSIITREFRENLTWAIVTPGEGEMIPAVKQLLADVEARGIPVEWIA